MPHLPRASPASTPKTRTVIHEGLPTQLPDIDPDKTNEWLRLVRLG